MSSQTLGPFDGVHGERRKRTELEVDLEFDTDTLEETAEPAVTVRLVSHKIAAPDETLEATVPISKVAAVRDEFESAVERAL